MQDRYAFYCGAAKVREGKSLPAGGVVQLKSLGQLEEFFEPQGAGKEFCRVCRMLLNVGVSGVYAVPLTVDGSQAGEELYEGALRKLCEIKRGGVILCDSTKPEVLHKLKEQVELASQNERERLAVGCVAKEQAAQTAKSLNCERMVLCCQKAGMKEESLTVCAAAVAAMLAVGEATAGGHRTTGTIERAGDRNAAGRRCDGAGDGRRAGRMYPLCDHPYPHRKRGGQDL